MCLAVGMALGWRLYARTQRDWREEAGRLERLLASDPNPRRHPGQPTNTDGEPAQVRDVRFRKEGFWNP